MENEFKENDFSFFSSRNPDRIDPFLKRIGDCWRMVPDWRFGQLVMNVLGEMQSTGRDPFFPEEDEMIKFFENYFDRTVIDHGN